MIIIPYLSTMNSIKNGSFIIPFSDKIAYMSCIILSIISISIISTLSFFFLPNYTISSFLKISKLVISHNKHTNIQSILPMDPLLMNLTFSINSIYHHHGIAYDYYSTKDLGQSKAAHQWKIWPLPHEINQNYSQNHTETSPFVMSKLPFVDAIYVMTDPSLTQRHHYLKKAFLRQGISIESIEWRMKWNYRTCNSNTSHSYVYQRMNLKDKPLDKEQQRKCALAMKHTDVWYEMAERKVRLGLILEDDAIFVPFFKEKFTRMIYASINYGILRMNGSCVKPKEKPISNDEWINQNPMIVIGTCFNFHGQYFQSHLSNGPPVLSTRKSNPSRCTHAYLLTSCSAQALVDQIQAQKNDFWPSDFMQNKLFPISPTLQSFWMDPPLSYQGNQVTDLDNIETYKRQTYK